MMARESERNRGPTASLGLRPLLPGLAFFALAALAPLATRDAYLLDTVILIVLWGALGGAWNLAGGYAGQVSLGHSSFFGLGAYAAALLTIRWNLSPWVGMAVGIALATTAGLIIGALSNRLRGPYFALATIAFSQVLLIVASRWRAVTKGSEGLPVPFRPGFWTFGFPGKGPWIALAIAFGAVVYLLSLYLEHSRVGYQLAGVREDEDAAQALGIHARRLKVGAITLSAALTAALGTCWAQYVGFVEPFYVFSLDLSVKFALMAIIGGMATAIGPFIGSALITALESYLRATLSGARGQLGLYLVIYGALLIIVVRFVPQGLVAWATGLMRGRAARAPVR